MFLHNTLRGLIWYLDESSFVWSLITKFPFWYFQVKNIVYHAVKDALAVLNEADPDSD